MKRGKDDTWCKVLFVKYCEHRCILGRGVSVVDGGSS